MPSHITLPAPAKINRFLHIVGRRDDGYHLLQTVFQYLEYGDTLHFETRPDGNIVVQTEPDCDIAMHDNLVYKAAVLLQTLSKVTLGVQIVLEKKLPMGGGLGGGSSDAATCLVGLNYLWGLGWPRERLQTLSQQLGADVPFFVFGESAFAEGTGEILTRFSLPPTWVLVVTPRAHVQTQKMYQLSELTRDSATLKIEALVQGEVETTFQSLRNDFEPVVRQYYPEVHDVLTLMSNFCKPRLSGSGACVFACFKTQSEAQYVAQQLPDSWKRFICRGLNESPLNKLPLYGQETVSQM